MALLALLGRSNGLALLKIALATFCSGLAQAGVIATVNFGGHATGTLRIYFGLAFLFCCFLYGASAMALTRFATDLVESRLCELRISLTQKSSEVDLETLEQLGTTNLYTQIIQSTMVISSLTVRLSTGIQASTTILITTGYVLWQFEHLWIVFGGAALFVYSAIRLRSAKLQSVLRDTAATKAALFDLATDAVAGAKEVHLNEARTRELQEDFSSLSHSLTTKSVTADILTQESYSLLNLSMFLVLGFIVLVLPDFHAAHVPFLVDLTATVVFLFHPVNQVFTALPEYERAEQAAQSISAIVQRLGDSATTPSPTGSSPFGSTFRLLEAVDLTFEHHDPSGRSSFRLGPLNLRIHAGQIVFLVGGNGSGKTTLFKLLSSLYSPISGQLLVNGVPVRDDNRWAHRQMLSAIFSDFHLFKKLYGIPADRLHQVDALLQQLGLSGKTKFQDGEFSHLALSSGQRKRLALLVALLEDRPVYLFDEWASDQDPEFREYYYTTLLPELKRRGKTVLAISHDDRYFSSADQLIHLDYGSLRTQSPPAISTSNNN